MDLKIGTIIKKLRSERGITQEELANKIGVSFQAVSKWETNTTTPDISILPKIALYFGVSMDALFSMDKDDYLERISIMIRDEYIISNENFTWAERYLKGVLSEEKHNNNARTLLVELYNHRVNHDLLINASLCEEGLIIEPTNDALLGNLVRVREKRQEIDRLINFLEELFSKNKYTDSVASALVLSNIKYGNIDAALKLLNELKNRPFYEVYRGDIELSLNNIINAKQYWETAVIKNNTNHHILFEVAERYKKIGEIETAINLYEKSYENSPLPQEMDPLYSLAFLYTENGMTEKAVSSWERIINVLSKDYGINDGECVAWARREIKKLQN